MSAVQERQLVEVKPLGAPLGADIEGVDLSVELKPEVVQAIKAAWLEHLVLRFRGQALSDAELIRFTACLGELEYAPIPASQVKVVGEDRYVEVSANTKRLINVVSNVIENGKAIGSFGFGEAAWHTDMSYNPEPPSGCALYALEVPLAGGDTMFANMHLAYETLGEGLRRRIEGRRCRHDASRNSAGELRRGCSDVTDPRCVVGESHPIVRTHSMSGRKAIYLPRRRNAYIEGLELEESEELLDLLWQHVTQPSLIWTQKWRVGDLLLWDNQCTIHSRDSFDPSTRRVMHRTQVKGSRPY